MADIYKYNNKMSVLTEEERNFDLTFSIKVPKSITMSYGDFLADFMRGEDKEVQERVWKALVKKAMESKYEEIDLGEAEFNEWDFNDDMSPIENHVDEVRDEVEETLEKEEKKEERIIVSKK